jgi:acetyl-CoA carboxylase biotin carboxyl carrier protein
LDLKAIKQVIDLMKRSELSEFELEEEGFKLRLSRKNGEAATQIIQAAPAATPVAVPAPVAETESAAPAEEAGISLVKSPMVGTFYRSPSPDSPSFVDVGAKISEDSVVCIIEAMKVMNEIQAEIKGTITEILVENGDSIEFGQPLFKVKK